ncbi:hypothetical protein GCM10010442_10880 [Kitasatospora kifunensis]|uniref:Uncharacterized protein n=1 Tax=Kitasatospora kifunensis TaxID=58351 RepID=A0A7W7R7M8_KITKI|nr:hypothetical protein [Kitasatospora kifunensis]
MWQHGPRRLWDETEAAHRWWLDNDRPGPDRFGLTLTGDAQHLWLDAPADVLPRFGESPESPESIRVHNQSSPTMW